MAIHKMRPGSTRRGLRGLGTIAVPVAGGMIYGSDVVARNGIRLPIVRPYPVNAGGVEYQPVWGIGYQPRTYPMNNGQNLAQLQALAQSNPAALTPSQVQALQAAGTIPGTLPPTASSLISTGSGAIDPATGQTYASELASAQATLASATTPTTATSTLDIGTMLSTPYAGLPLYEWLAIAAGAYLFLGRKRGR